MAKLAGHFPYLQNSDALGQLFSPPFEAHNEVLFLVIPGGWRKAALRLRVLQIRQAGRRDFATVVLIRVRYQQLTNNKIPRNLSVKATDNTYRGCILLFGVYCGR